MVKHSVKENIRKMNHTAYLGGKIILSHTHVNPWMEKIINLALALMASGCLPGGNPHVIFMFVPSQLVCLMWQHVPWLQAINPYQILTNWGTCQLDKESLQGKVDHNVGTCPKVSLWMEETGYKSCLLLQTSPHATLTQTPWPALAWPTLENAVLALLYPGVLTLHCTCMFPWIEAEVFAL